MVYGLPIGQARFVAGRDTKLYGRRRAILDMAGTIDLDALSRVLNEVMAW